MLMYRHTLHYITLRYIALHYIKWHYITLHTYIYISYIRTYYMTLHRIAFIALEYITLHWMTLYDITLCAVYTSYTHWHTKTLIRTYMIIYDIYIVYTYNHMCILYFKRQQKNIQKPNATPDHGLTNAALQMSWSSLRVSRKSLWDFSWLRRFGVRGMFTSLPVHDR